MTISSAAFDGTSAAALRDFMEPGERLLWAGRPRQGLLLRRGDRILILVSLVWLAFAVFLEALVITKGRLANSGAVFMTFLGALFVAVGVYQLVGRFFTEAFQRARTFYAVTDRRVLIASHVLRHRVLAFAIDRLIDIDLRAETDDLGTLTFGRNDPSIRADFPILGMRRRSRRFAQFMVIDSADDVLRLIREAQRTKRQNF